MIEHLAGSLISRLLYMIIKTNKGYRWIALSHHLIGQNMALNILNASDIVFSASNPTSLFTLLSQK